MASGIAGVVLGALAAGLLVSRCWWWPRAPSAHPDRQCWCQWRIAVRAAGGGAGAGCARRTPAATTARPDRAAVAHPPAFPVQPLNTAIALVRDEPAAESLLEDLSDLFRWPWSKGRSRDPGRDLELARRYLAIEQVRFGERLRVQWQLDPVPTQPCCPLLLQPLVENAVKHGVNPAPWAASCAC